MLIVQKYGGSSVANAERVFNVAKRIMRARMEGNDVVVVLSAQGKTTDGLIAKAKEINAKPSRREMDMLLSTGGTAVCCADGNGNQCDWRQSGFSECGAGGD